MKLETPKGTRDMLPERAIKRNQLITTLRTIFEKYGYNPLETPALEYESLLTAKFAGGEEILKEMYTLTDQGKRKLALRYDLTVPFARVVASQQLKLPFKRYQIAPVWRDGPIKKGRYRQFTQCDVDVVGIKNIYAEAELLAMAADFFKTIELEVELTFNNRKVLDAMMESIPEKKREKAILILDKLKKVGKKGVEKELAENDIDSNILQYVDMDLATLKTSLKNKEGIEEVEQLLSALKQLGVKAIFDSSLARGLTYYTGTIYEGFLKNNEITSSVCAGGRYDNMISEFAGKDMPAVGISFGIDVLLDAMQSSQKSVVEVYVIPIGTTEECLKVAKELRKTINADMDMNGKSISKNLDYVSKQGIPYALLIGEDELKAGKYTLKDMVKGKEKKVTLKDLQKL